MQTEIHDHWLVIVHVHALFQRHLSLFSFNVLRIPSRAGDSLIGFLSESLVFCEKMSEWAIHSKKLSNALIFGERPEQIAQGCSFMESNLSDSLTLLIYGEQHERFVHIAHFWWATWAIGSYFSLKKREWENHLFLK